MKQDKAKAPSTPPPLRSRPPRDRGPFVLALSCEVCHEPIQLVSRGRLIGRYRIAHAACYPKLCSDIKVAA